MSALTTIGTFYTYEADGFTTVATGVSRVSAGISGGAGAWSLKIVISLVAERFGPERFAGFVSGGRHFRFEADRTYRTRELAKGAARTILGDHLGYGFTGASLRVNGRDRGAL